MPIGPLEYVVVGIAGSHEHSQLTRALLTELNAIQEKDHIRVVDLVLAHKAADGRVSLQELTELDDEKEPAYPGIAEDLAGLLTAQDLEQLTSPIPPNASAFVILLEHAWVVGLTEAVRQGGGVVFAGGLVGHETLQRINSELEAKEARHA
jgi:hypothetical protein